MAVKKRKCKQCKQFTETFIVTNGGVFCNFDSAVKFAVTKRDKDRGKAKQVQVKQDKKATSDLKRNNKRHQLQLTKSVIQRWVNHVRDAGLPCISCGTEKQTIQYCGSHYKSAGGHPETALVTRNIHKACNRYCNKALSGNIHGNKTSKGYTVGLVERYDQSYVDWLDGPHESPRYDCDQLIEIRAFYSKLIRDNNPDDYQRPF